jgi:hypothetical protein
MSVGCWGVEAGRGILGTPQKSSHMNHHSAYRSGRSRLVLCLSLKQISYILCTTRTVL